LENNNIADEIIQNSNKKILQKYWQAPLNGLLPLTIVMIFLIIYIYAMLFGQTSVFVLMDTQNRQQNLNKKYQKLQHQNQKLQKKYFELIQLTPDDDAF